MSESTLGRGRPGFRILPSPSALDAPTVARFAAFAAANVADAMGRFNFMDPGIRSRSALPIRGEAMTVTCRPGDNLMLHKALEVARPGDVVVVTTGGNISSAVFGDLMCRAAVARKLGGIIVDGAIRDVHGISAMSFPAFSRSVSPGACDKDGPGEINVPVACGGVVVNPGDMVVGDDDGVAVVPRADISTVLAELAKIADREAKRVAEIERGVIIRPDVDDVLRAKGVI